jgi:hypothetical protein
MRCVDDYKWISKRSGTLLKSVSDQATRCVVPGRDGVVCAGEERFEERKRQQDG